MVTHMGWCHLDQLTTREHWSGRYFRPLKESQMFRKHVNKHSSAKSFRRNVGKTKSVNVAAVMRGGIRL